MAESEIAHLRQQIAAEFAAAHRALHEYATVAKHEIITNRFNQAGLYTDELAHLVGKEEAMNIAGHRVTIQVPYAVCGGIWDLNSYKSNNNSPMPLVESFLVLRPSLFEV